MERNVPPTQKLKGLTLTLKWCENPQVIKGYTKVSFTGLSEKKIKKLELKSQGKPEFGQQNPLTKFTGLPFESLKWCPRPTGGKRSPGKNQGREERNRKSMEGSNPSMGKIQGALITGNGKLERPNLQE